MTQHDHDGGMVGDFRIDDRIPMATCAMAFLFKFKISTVHSSRGTELLFPPNLFKINIKIGAIDGLQLRWIYYMHANDGERLRIYSMARMDILPA